MNKIIMKHVKQKFFNMNEQNKNAFVGNDNMIDNITKCVKAAPIHFFIHLAWIRLNINYRII